MSQPRRLSPDGSSSKQQQQQQQQQPPPPDQRPQQIMLHEALAIFWSVYVLYRFLELTVEEPMNRLEFYTQ